MPQLTAETHRFDDDVDGVTYCSKCGWWEGAAPDVCTPKSRQSERPAVVKDMKELSLAEVRQLAHRAQQELSGFNGDPAKRASWARERQLASIVLALVERIDGLGYSVLVKP